jgi:hypothetical protein
VSAFDTNFSIPGEDVVAGRISVVSQSQSGISVLCPPDGMGTVFLCIGIVLTILGGVLYYRQRNWSIATFPLYPGLLLLIMGGYLLTSVTTINASRNTGELTVRHTVAGVQIKNRVYSFSEIQNFRVGFMHGTRYLYVDLTDGSSPQVLPNSYRGGYDQAADALNSFLGSSGGGGEEGQPSR